MKKGTKRLDLQGIRAMAIIVVLGFHFYPNVMPNGYLGVDQFFVLSGFLMCMLLKRAHEQKEPACSLIMLFYSKRFKRILPLYLLIITCSLLALYTIFTDTAIETNKQSAVNALLFTSNRARTVQEDYFSMLSIAIDIFTHTWSLSVEIQFYFLVPFIFLISQKLLNHQMTCFGALGALSYWFSVIATENLAFNCVFARIWQFSIGMVVYIWSTSDRGYNPYNLIPEESEALLGQEDVFDTEKSINTSKIFQFSSYILLSMLLIILSVPVALPAQIVRPLVTISTGFLILLSEHNALLSHKLLTYTGDVSYSLYLIHWPIYAYWKLSNGSQLTLLIALLASILLAVLIFETFEKWYLGLSSTSIGALVLVLFLANVALINKDEIQGFVEDYGKNVTSLDGVTKEMTLDDAARMNHRWTVYDNQNLYAPSCIYEQKNTPLGWCRHTGLHGKYKMATIGNSYAANHAKIFYQECGGKAKSILQGSADGCEPLYPSHRSKMCFAYFKDFRERIEREKPDFGFIITRFISTDAPINSSNLHDDPIYQTMLNQTLSFTKNIKFKLYILDYIPRLWTENIGKITESLKNKITPKDIDNYLIKMENYDNAKRRIQQLAQDCGAKCVLIDYAKEFWQNASKTYRYFDERGFSYFTAPMHMSPRGLEHVRHVWRELCDKL